MTPLSLEDATRLLALAHVEPANPRFPVAVARLGASVGTYHLVASVRGKGRPRQKRGQDLRAIAGALRKVRRLLAREDLHSDVIDGWLRIRATRMDDATEQRWANKILASLRSGGEMAQPWLEDMGDDVRALADFADAADAASARYSRSSPIAVLTEGLADLWEFLGNRKPTGEKDGGVYIPTEFTDFALQTLKAIDGEDAHGKDALEVITDALDYWRKLRKNAARRAARDKKMARVPIEPH